MRVFILALSVFILSACGSKPLPHEPVTHDSAPTKDTFPPEKTLLFDVVSSSIIPQPDGSPAGHFYTISVDSFTASFADWAKIRIDAESRIKSGVSGVLYFNSKRHTPKLKPGKSFDFDESSDKYCIAGYWLYADNSVTFRHYPMR